jgi:DUF1009 family protein
MVRVLNGAICGSKNRRKREMNISLQTENAQRLVKYDITGDAAAKERRKITVELSEAYHEVLKRMALVQGKTKTAVVRQALDLLAEQMGEEVLFPTGS